MEPSSYHTPVLLSEVLASLITTADGVYVDGTLGGGGHAEAILSRLSPRGRLIGLDVDEDALRTAGARLAPSGNRVLLVRSNFRELGAVVRANGEAADGILLDLGVSSFQLDAPEKGFSFRADERLDMRMDRRSATDARSVVNGYPEDRLADILHRYGEERRAGAIGRAIVRERQHLPIERTGQLAAIVERAVGGAFLTKTLARVFQAVRIEVNNELECLREAIEEGMNVLRPGGRFVILSYHSLEDRIVKEQFREASATVRRSAHQLLPDIPLHPRIRLLTRKPVVAGERETGMNPRARSAKLRAAERL